MVDKDRAPAEAHGDERAAFEAWLFDAKFEDCPFKDDPERVKRWGAHYDLYRLEGWQARAALASKAQPKHTPKPCLVAGDCKHGSWCSDVYCQEHCQFVKGTDALDALAELCDMAKGGWGLPPSAVERIGALARKASAALQSPAPAPEVDSGEKWEADVECITDESGTDYSVSIRGPGLRNPDYSDVWLKKRPAEQLAKWLNTSVLPRFNVQGAAVQDGWRPIEQGKPTPNVRVLATYLNQLGNRRTIIARWTPAKTVEASGDDDGPGTCEYDEATDTHYLVEGWWECVNNWDEYSQVFVTEGAITHWAPLPAAPEGNVPVQPMGDANG